MTNAKTHIITCMLCDKTTTIVGDPDLTFHDLLFLASAIKNWAMSWSNGGFICCEDCYPKAFDKSAGGRVGFLRKEFEHMRRKE